MAEDPEVAGDEKQSSPLVKNIILFGGAMLVPAILGAAVFLIAIKPKLGDAPPPMVEEDVVDALPAGVMEVQFEQAMSSVMADDPDLAPPVLMYQVALLALDQMTAEAIGAKKALFQAKITKLHMNRTEKELNDPYVQDTILRQVKQETNTLLKRLYSDQEYEVLEAMYLKFATVAL